MLAIKNNIMAMNASRHLGTSYAALGNSVERLSSGLRINSAKDDAAGLAVRELMRADIAVQQQGSRNAQDGVSMLQTMEGAMAVMDENLIRMMELAEQAATGSYSASQRAIMNAEFEEMANEIERIANATKFNEIAMMNDDSGGQVSVHVGTDETIDIDKVDMTKTALGIQVGTGGYGATFDQADQAVADTDTATFLNVANNDVTLDIAFDNGGDAEATISVDFAAGDYTLEEVVDTINMASQNLGNDASGDSQNYSAAEIVQTESGDYTLKLNSSDMEADGVTITGTGDGGDSEVTIGTATALTLGSTGADVTAFTGAVNEGIDILSAETAQDALDAVENAIHLKDGARAMFGYKMNRLESTISILGIQVENLQASESRISDVDVATEMAQLTRTQVLSQAGVSMLAQANSMPQMALSLLG